MISLVHGLKEYHLNPEIGAQYNYRFETIVDDFTNEKRPIQKSYIRNVMLMPIGKQDSLDVYQIFTAKISIKSNVAVADEYLIKQLGYAFDEIEAGVDNSGKIIRIYNLKELQFRWNLTREKLEQEYIGVAVEVYYRSIDAILNNEKQLIDFLSSYKMFGLYFHGLFGNYLLWEMPIKRENRAEDFENVLVNETIFPEKRDVVKYKIEAKSSALDRYEGQLIYDDFQLQEALMECKNDTQSIKYGALFLG